MHNFTRESALDLSKRRRVNATPRQLETQSVRVGDVLFNSTNSPELVGKSAFIDHLGEPTVFSNHFMRLRTDPSRLDSEYLAHFLRYEFGRGTFRAMAKGWVNQATVGRDRLERLAVPLPALAEQGRIVAILRRAEAVRGKRLRLLAQLDSLVLSVFRSLFGDQYWRSITGSASTVSNELGWPWVPLSRVARLATGHTPDRKNSAYWDDGNIPWISLPEIRALDGRTAMSTELAVTAEGLANSSAVMLPVGTVCFSRTASVGFVTKLGVPMATSQDFHNWVPTQDLDSTYLMSALRYSRGHLLGLSDGSIHKTIYQRTAQKFAVLLPPLVLQKQFATRAAQVDKYHALARLALAGDDELLVSLQASAFRGEL